MSGECKVDKIRPEYLSETIKSARTLEDVFASLHILQNGDKVLAPPNRIDPQDPDLAGRYRDIGADRWPYLAASRGGYSVSNLFANGSNSDALNCALSALNYSESQGKAVADKVDEMRGANKTESEVQGYLGGLPASDQRNYEIFNTLRFMRQFDKGPESLDKDGDFSVISRDDLTNWAEGLGDDGQVQGEKAVVRMHVILGLVNYFANPPAHALTPAGPADAGASDSGVSDAADAGAKGPFVISVNPPETTSAPQPAPATTPSPSSTDGILSFGLKFALGAVGFTALGSVATYLLMRHRNASSAAAPTETAKTAAPRKDAPEARTEKATEKKVVKTETKTYEKTPSKGGDEDLNEVLDDLAKAKANQTPTGGASPKNTGSASLVTSENIIISGSKAEPISGVDANVVRAQVVLHYRQFLSQSAREALLDGRALPENIDLVNSSFKREVDEMTDRIVAEYYQKSGTVEGRETISDLWKSQLDDRGYIVRRGVPQRLLIEVATAYINEHSKSASSPFAGGVGAEMRVDAERHSGETKFFEEGLRDLMKHIGR